MKKIKYVFKKVFYQLFSIGIFLVISVYFIMRAYGFQVDIEAMNVVPTSVLDVSTVIDSQGSGAQVFIDETLVSDQTPVNLRNLPLGDYVVTIKKQGYLTWSKNVSLDPYQVTALRNVFLIPSSFSTTTKSIAHKISSYDISPQENYLAILYPQSDYLEVIALEDGKRFIFYNPGVIEEFYWLSDTQIIAKNQKDEVYIFSVYAQTKSISSLKLFITMKENQNTELEEGILVDGHEIWDAEKGELLSRFGVTVEEAEYVHDKGAILYTTPQSIFITDKNLQNSVKIGSKDAHTSVYYVEHTKTLYGVLDGSLFETSLNMKKATQASALFDIL